MKELIEVIAKSLVDHPSEEVVVTETVSGDDLLLELKVNPSDMGKVIGRQGRIAESNPYGCKKQLPQRATEKLS